ncbi:MAG: PAS domain S-box protein [Anaerolineae bacterium]|nr:PAS domain S-box protein [Anaerolineae bacterium]
MEPYATPYLLIFSISAMLSWSLAFHAANHLGIRGAKCYLFISLSQTFWTVCYSLELVSGTVSEKILWDSIQWLPALVIPVAILRFSETIARTRWQVPLAALFVVPTAFLLLLLTEGGHALLYRAPVILESYPFDSLDYQYGLAHWLIFLYSYALIALGLALLIWRWRSASGFRRAQLTWLILGIGIMLVLEFGGMLFDFRVFGQRDLSPYSFGLGNAILGWGLFRYRLFDLAPRARRLAVERMSDGFIVTNEQMLIVDMNQAARRIIPVHSDFIGESLNALLEAWSLALDAPTLLAGQPQQVQVERGAQTFIYELNLTPITTPDQSVDGYLLISRDVTVRRNLEESLRQSERRYRTMFETLTDSVLLYGADGAIVAANQASEQIFGLKREAMIGKTLDDFRWGAIREDGSPLPVEEYPVYAATQKGRAARSAVLGLRTPAKGLIWLSISAEPLCGDERPPCGAIASIRDITDYKAIQAKTVELRLERERAALLTNFIHGAAHEFRTPLSTISTSLYLITRHSDEGRRRDHVRKAEQEVFRLARLVDLQSKLASLDSGMILTFTPASLEAMIEQMIEQYASKAAAARIVLIADTASALPSVYCNRDYLLLALEQVLDNALRFTSAGGYIYVRLSHSESAVKIVITDTGSGIRRQDMPHIFERFWRRDAAHALPGFGLGLPLAQAIIALHSGTISVDSQEGRGTSVTISLPYAPRLNR